MSLKARVNGLPLEWSNDDFRQGMHVNYPPFSISNLIQICTVAKVVVYMLIWLREIIYGFSVVSP